MKRRALEWLACPLCGQGLNAEEVCEEFDIIEQGILKCPAAHRFPVIGGVPRLRPADLIDGDLSGEDTSAATAISESFGVEWSHFDYEQGRTWHQALDERCRLFLREIDCSADELRGRLILDAGCGNGSLSDGISRFGCQVLALDVSASVARAQAYYAKNGTGDATFVQADLMFLPVRRGIADVVYSSGVLHHNPDTRAALRSILRALKPRGRVYIWVYHREPGTKFGLQLRLRGWIAPLPMWAKRGFVYAWSAQSMVRQHLRTVLGRNDERDRLSWGERVIDLMDIYTPRYRWMHSQEEVQGWYAEFGMEDIRRTEVRDWGFGVLARAPQNRPIDD